MLKSLKFSLLVVSLIIVPVIVFGMVAQNEETCDSCQAGEQSQAQTEAQVQANNLGTGEMTQEQIQEKATVRTEECQMDYEPQMDLSKERQGVVNGAVSEIAKMSAGMEDQALGDKLYGLAKKQSESEDLMNKSFDTVDKRWAITEFILGPNYKELKKVKQEMEENRVRIGEMNQVLAEIQNEGDRIELQIQLDILEEQQTKLQDNLDEAEGGLSLLGWFFKMIYGY